MKEVEIISKVVGRGGAGASVPSAGVSASVNLGAYALKSDVEALAKVVNEFLEGDDTDVVINKWTDLVAFLEGISEEYDLLSMLGMKADKATTLAGYGITDAYTKTNVDDLLKLYVTLAGTQTITGEKDFTGGLKVNGSPIVYDATNKYWKLEGDLLVTGGVTMFASDSAFTPSTIMDAIATDGTNLQVVDGVLTFVGETGGLTEVYWDDVIGKPTLLSSFIDDVGYLKKSGGQMTGNIGYTLDPDTYAIGLPTAGTIEDSSSIFDEATSSKSFIGTIYEPSGWYNVISVRHRNGYDDGFKYGMALYNQMTSSDGSLYYRKHVNGNWTGARVILDSVNWSQYVTAADGGNYLPLSGGTLNGNLNLGGNKINNVQTLQFASGVRGAANSGCSILGAFDAPYSATIQLGGYGTTPPSNATSSYYSFKIVDNAWTSELFMVNNDGKNVFGCKSAINDNSHVRGINLAGQLKFPSTTPTIPHPMIFGNGSYLTIGYGNVTNYGIVIASGEVRPNATDLFNLGVSSYRWKSIHTIDAFLGGYAQFDDMTGAGGMNTGAARIGTFDHTEGGLVIQLGKVNTTSSSSGKQKFEIINPVWDKALLALDRAGNLLVAGGITMYSDIRKKTILNHVELTLQQIADAPLIEHYYNSDENRTIHVGSIAQYWAGLNDWFCKLDNEGYYTMEIQNAALASAISIARHLQKYESKTDRAIRKLKQRVSELEEEMEKLKSA